MSGNDMEWQRPLTPWRVVQRRFFAEKGLDPVPFSAKYGLDEQAVRMVLGEMQTELSPELCSALSQETGMTPAFFARLSDQYRQNVR